MAQRHTNLLVTGDAVGGLKQRVHHPDSGTYTREELYGNTVKFLKRGVDGKTEPRYTMVSTIPGYNSIAVERQEVDKDVASNHLAVFEFHSGKVSKIIEYGK